MKTKIEKIQEQLVIARAEMLKLASMLDEWPEHRSQIRGAASMLDEWYEAIGEEEKK